MYKTLLDEDMQFDNYLDELCSELQPAPKDRKRRLTEDEYGEVLVNYWDRRRENAHDREEFVKAAMEWVVYAFLHADNSRGKFRNHEIAESADTDRFIDHLRVSCSRMLDDIRCKVEMSSVCWWDVQEHYHNLVPKQIDDLAEDLFEPLIIEAVERLKANGFISWHSGFWNLSTAMSHSYIQRLNRRKRIFLAPKPSKLALVYAA